MLSSKVIIVDYGMGNLFSIQRAVLCIGGNAKVSDDPFEVMNADRLILPGVGAFGKGVEELHKRGLVEAIYRFNEKERPLLGICLGMQLLLSESYEFGFFKGLNFVSGKVVRFQDPIPPEINFKIPHMGWNELKLPQHISSLDYWKNTILHHIPIGGFGYFVHSFIVMPDDSRCVLAETVYGRDRFCSVLWKNHILGCQFHPERSGEMGLNIYKQFLFNI